MRYDQNDLATLERHAFSNGDTLLADVAGQALDNEAECERADRLHEIVEGIRERIAEANYKTGKKQELRDLIDAIINELNEGN